MSNKILLAVVPALALVACQQEQESASENATIAEENVLADNMLGAPMDAAVPASGQEYADKAAASDLYEIQSAQLALEKSQNDGIRELSNMLVTDHQTSTQQLRDAAGQAQPAVTVNPALDAEQQANMTELQGLTGAAFDEAFLRQQLAAHEKALTMLQGYATQGTVEPLKQHAATAAGPVERHLQRVRELSQAAPAQP